MGGLPANIDNDGGGGGGGGGFADPLTTAGDIIARDATNTTTRVAAGKAGQVLTSGGPGAVPAWAASSSGRAFNPSYAVVWWRNILGSVMTSYNGVNGSNAYASSSWILFNGISASKATAGSKAATACGYSNSAAVYAGPSYSPTVSIGLQVVPYTRFVSQIAYPLGATPQRLILAMLRPGTPLHISLSGPGSILSVEQDASEADTGLCLCTWDGTTFVRRPLGYTLVTTTAYEVTLESSGSEARVTVQDALSGTVVVPPTVFTGLPPLVEPAYPNGWLRTFQGLETKDTTLPSVYVIGGLLESTMLLGLP